ncbi:hypothetical protein LUX01_13820 [Streptomyces sudanensis]|uniref:hypothetical protein n=1 Tax=Streptomyces sudanensis TaxID=436397 RepID=UPI0020CD032C|nr:hypothetical protein [Streptomyces sudanensis]MCP9987605.1 hypothetical protein [Streptomyces sudanensis]
MRVPPFAVGLWYVAAGALLVFGGDGLRPVLGLLLTAEGAVLVTRGGRASRGDARARLDVRLGCWATLVIVAVAAAVWVYGTVSGGARPLTDAVLADGLLLQGIALTVPAAAVLLTTRREA